MKQYHKINVSERGIDVNKTNASKSVCFVAIILDFGYWI